MQQQQKNRVNYSVSKEVYEMEIYIGWVILDVAEEGKGQRLHTFVSFVLQKKIRQNKKAVKGFQQKTNKTVTDIATKSIQQCLP